MYIGSNASRVFVALGLLGCAAVATGASVNGSAGQMPAFYEGDEVTVNMKELPDDASEALIAHNQSVNEIYATNDLDEEQDFEPVIDAIQGEGFNPLWRQILIEFNPASRRTSSSRPTRWRRRRKVRILRSR
jgi:hypothetical protein